jgi:hypothetical protein
MLSPVIRKKIEHKFGAPIRYPKDCDSLANAIFKQCRCKISGSTLKRLFGLIKGTEKPRMWTLDALANYLDHDSWDDLIDQIAGNKKVRTPKIESVVSRNIESGTIYSIAFGRHASIVLEYKGKNLYEVIEQTKTVLIRSDYVHIERIQLHLPLLVNSIHRGKIVLEGILIGNVTGTTSIKILKANEIFNGIQTNNIINRNT